MSHNLHALKIMVRLEWERGKGMTLYSSHRVFLKVTHLQLPLKNP